MALTTTFRLATYKRAKDGLQQILFCIYVDGTDWKGSAKFKVAEKLWDEGRMRVKGKHPNAAEINDWLKDLEERAQKEYAALLKKGGVITAKRIADSIFTNTDFHAYLEEFHNKMTGITQGYSRKTVNTMRKMLKEYRPKLNLEEIDLEFIEGFAAFLRARPGRDAKRMADPTLRKRMIDFKVAYEKHKKRLHPSPFEGYKLPSGERTKEPVPLTEAEIEALWNVEPRNRMEAEAKDIFLFSYYATGMRPGDVVCLLWEEVSEEGIFYLENKKEHLSKRRKVMVFMNERLRILLDRREKGRETVFGFFKDGEEMTRQRIDVILSARRDDIKILAARAGIDKWISFKLARNTFAAIAYEKAKWDLKLIQDNMNHSTAKQTLAYTGESLARLAQLQRATYGK